MQRYRIAQFDRIAAAHTLWRGQKDSLPAPFPGRWPTRIAWHVQAPGHFNESYIGKPVIEAIARYTRFSTQPKLFKNNYLIEFDRKHIPVYLWSQWEGMQIHPVLWSVYHYWQPLLSYAAHFSVPNFQRRLDGVSIYAPFRVLTLERKQAWAAYMRNATLVELKPIPNVPERS